MLTMLLAGINLEFARLLLQHGANVLIADLALRPEAQELVKQYEAKSNKAIFQKTDVTSWPQLEAMFTVAQEAFGSVDIVCPGAGVFEEHWSNFWYPPGSEKSRDALDSGRQVNPHIVLILSSTQTSGPIFPQFVLTFAQIQSPGHQSDSSHSCHSARHLTFPVRKSAMQQGEPQVNRAYCQYCG
jgi:hypothetical protein